MEAQFCANPEDGNKFAGTLVKNQKEVFLNYIWPPLDYQLTGRNQPLLINLQNLFRTIPCIFVCRFSDVIKFLMYYSQNFGAGGKNKKGKSLSL